MATYDIADDTELREEVRSYTGYTSEHISNPDLKADMRVAKRILATEIGGDPDFYDDRGLTQALFGTLCVEAKCTVENDAVASYDFGQGVDVEARDSDGNSLQVQRYEEHIQTGWKNADIERDMQLLGNTSGFIG